MTALSSVTAKVLALIDVLSDNWVDVSKDIHAPDLCNGVNISVIECGRIMASDVQWLIGVVAYYAFPPLTHVIEGLTMTYPS